MKFTISKNEPSSKLDFNLQNQLATMPKADKELALFRIFIRSTAPLSVDGQDYKNAAGVTVPGITIRSNTADAIYTAEVSVAGLKALEKDDKVASLSGSRALRPL